MANKNGFLPLHIVFKRYIEEGDKKFKERVDFYENQFKHEFINNWRVREWDDAANKAFFSFLYDFNKVCIIFNPKVVKVIREKNLRLSPEDFFTLAGIICNYNVKSYKKYGFPQIITPIITNQHNEKDEDYEYLTTHDFKEGVDCSFFYLLPYGSAPLSEYVEFNCKEMAKYDADIDKQIKIRSVAAFITDGMTNRKGGSNNGLEKDINKSIYRSGISLTHIQQLATVIDLKRPEDYDKIRIERDKVENRIKCKLGLVTLNIPQKKERLLTAETDDAENQRIEHISQMMKNLKTCFHNFYKYFGIKLTVECLCVGADNYEDDYEIYTPDQIEEKNEKK